MMNCLKQRLTRFKRELQMDFYLLFHNPCKAKPIKYDIHAASDYARSMNKRLDELTRQEVKQFYLK